MIYGERVRYARNRLGYSRIELANVLDTTERNIANIENSKDESKKLGWDKMLKLIDVANLPAGYFMYSIEDFNDIVVNRGKDEVFAKVMRGGTMLEEELEEVLEIIKQLPRKT